MTPRPVGEPIVASTQVGPLRCRTTLIALGLAVPVVPPTAGWVGSVSFVVAAPVVVDPAVVVFVLYDAVGCGGKRAARTTPNDRAANAAAGNIPEVGSRPFRFPSGR